MYSSACSPNQLYFGAINLSTYSTWSRRVVHFPSTSTSAISFVYELCCPTIYFKQLCVAGWIRTTGFLHVKQMYLPAIRQPHILYPYRESNPDFRFRKPTFYPLNYKGICGSGRIRTSNVHPVGTVLQTVVAPPSLLHSRMFLSSYKYRAKLELWVLKNLRILVFSLRGLRLEVKLRCMLWFETYVRFHICLNPTSLLVPVASYHSLPLIEQLPPSTPLA